MADDSQERQRQAQRRRDVREQLHNAITKAIADKNLTISKGAEYQVKVFVDVNIKKMAADETLFNDDHVQRVADEMVAFFGKVDEKRDEGQTTINRQTLGRAGSEYNFVAGEGIFSG